MSIQLSNRLARSARRLMLVTIALALTAGTVPALAHHAFAAEYDGDKPLDLNGVVTKARWVNPHSWLYFDVKSADGTVINWGVELAAPNALASKGIAKSDLGTGAKVHVKGFLSKAGGPWGYAELKETIADPSSSRHLPASSAGPSEAWSPANPYSQTAFHVLAIGET